MRRVYHALESTLVLLCYREQIVHLTRIYPLMASASSHNEQWCWVNLQAFSAIDLESQP